MKFTFFEFLKKTFLTFSIVKGYFQEKNRINSIVNRIGLKPCRYSRNMLESVYKMSRDNSDIADVMILNAVSS